MNYILRGSIALCLITLTVSFAMAQYPEDALRLSTPGLSVGARALGMGTVWTGSSNDWSAMYTNPAGLGQMHSSEVSGGLSNFSYGNDATFFNKTTSTTNSSTALNNIGFVYPFPTTRGSMVFAAGYNRDADYTTALSFKGFNNSSSIIPTLDPGNTDGLGYNLYLMEANGYTPIQDSLQQAGKVLEGGEVNNWTVSGAIEAAQDFYLGLSLTFVSGSYTYNRTYSEADAANKYTFTRFGNIGGYNYTLNELDLLSTINDDIGGFTAKFGMIYKPTPAARIGVSVKIPTYYSIQETWTNDGTSYFKVPPDSAGNYSFDRYQDGNSTYDVHTPFVLNAGFSYTFGDLMVAGDVDYTDWTQMEFSNADPVVMQNNTDIKSLFRATTNFRVGGEYEIPTTGIRLRAGYAYLPSPYQGDPSDYAQKYVTAGAGFIVQNSIAFDIGYAHGTYNTLHSNYDATSQTSEKINTNTLVGTLSYRF